MRYLFIGGSQDGKHKEVADNIIQVRHETMEEAKLVGVDWYGKKMLCHNADGATCYVFVETSIPDQQVLWRLVSNYKKVA